MLTSLISPWFSALLLLLLAAPSPLTASPAPLHKRQTCSNLIVDDFSSSSNFAANVNSFGGYTSDDASLSIRRLTAGQVELAPKAGGAGYWYTTFNCLASANYRSLTLTISGPANSRISIELQASTSATCGTTTRSYTNVNIGTTPQTVTIPFTTSFSRIIAIAVSGWSVQGSYFIDDVVLVPSTCTPTPSPSPSPAASPSPSSSPAVSPTASPTPSPAASPSASPAASPSPSPAASPSPSPVASPSPSPAASPSPGPSTCNTLLIDDFSSATNFASNRNTYGGYTSDDSTLSTRRLTSGQLELIPRSAGTGYWYTTLNCLATSQPATATTYGSVSLKLSGPGGSRVVVELQTSGSATCGTRASTYTTFTLGTAPQTFTIPIGAAHLDAIAVSSWSVAGSYFVDDIVVVPTSCSQTPTTTTSPAVSLTVSATVSPTVSPTATPTPAAGTLLIDDFASATFNRLGGEHYCWDSVGCTRSVSGNTLTINVAGSTPSAYADATWETWLTYNGCFDVSGYGFLRIAATVPTGHDFTIGLTQLNSLCRNDLGQDIQTWGEVIASQYIVTANRTAFASGVRVDLYVPLSAFNIDLRHVRNLRLSGFTRTGGYAFHRIELVPVGGVPGGVTTRPPQTTAPMHLLCKKPNTIAFGIDDGVPELTTRVFDIINRKNIKVTFFTTGAGIENTALPFASLYRNASLNGHEIQAHSYDHPYHVPLTDAAMRSQFDRTSQLITSIVGKAPTLWRPPFGNFDARARAEAKRLGMDVVLWSVDVQDWIWGAQNIGNGPLTPSDSQLDAYKKAIDNYLKNPENRTRGGLIVVMHYLYTSTVDAFEAMIEYAVGRGLT
ncbi:hypothetical protein HK102_006745, partial [Quaeritorhiza haematococci]